MTEKVIVTIIGTVGTLAVTIIGGFFALAQSRKKDADAKRVDIDKEVASVVPVAPDAKVSELPKTEPAKVQKINSTHKEVADAIEAAPPYHQDKIQESFKGLYVHWNLSLSSVGHFNDRVCVYGHICDKGDENCFVRCYATPEDALIFVSAKEDWTFAVDGRIERISKYEAELRECKFSELRAVDPSSGSGG